MRSVGLILYFIFTLIILIFTIVFILFFLSRDLNSPPVDVFSFETNLYFTIRTRNRYITADSLKDLFLTSWNMVSDPSGTGSITLRNAYDGKWLYFEPDEDGNAANVVANLNVRQPADVDPIGWFYMETGDMPGSVKLKSLHLEGKYMYAIPFGSDVLSFVRIGDTQGSFRFQT